MSNRTVLVNLQANVAGYMASMRAASAATAQMAGTAAKSTAAAATPMKQLGQEARMLPMGLSATTTAMGGLAIAAGMSAKAAIDWDSAWAGVTKTVDGSPEQMAALEGELRELAKTLPATHEEIAGVAEAAGQLGIQRENVTSFTKTMIDLGETTNLSADQAATSLARFMNIMGTSQSDVSNLGSSVVELGNNFATTEAEIVDMAMRIAGAGRQIGMSEGDVLGLATALSSVGIEAEAGGTAISRVMIDMAKAVDTGSDKLGIFAQVAGQSTAEFTAAFRDDAGAALTSFIVGLDGVSQSGQSITPILEALDLDAIRVGDSLRRASASSGIFSEAMQTGNDAYRENTALTDEAAKRYETLAARIDVAKNKAKDAAISIGGPLAEAFVDIVEPIAAAVDALSSFNDGVQRTLRDSSSIAGDMAGGEGWSFFYNIGDLLGDVGRSFTFYRIALTEGTEAAEAFWAASDGAASAAAGTADALGPTVEESEAYARSLAGATDETFELAESAEAAAGKVDDLKDAILGLGGAYSDVQGAQDGVTQAVIDAKKPFEDIAQAQAELAEAQAYLAQADSDAERESRSAAVARAEQALATAEAAITLKGNSQAALDNRAAMRALADQVKLASAELMDIDETGRSSREEMRKGRKQFLEVAESLGYTEGEARKYARQLGLIPGRVPTDIVVNGADQAIADAARVQASLLGIKDRYVNVFVDEVRRDNARASAADQGIQRKDGGWIGAPRFTGGGWVSGGGTSKSDSVKARLSRGEFVVNAFSAANNAALLEAINSGKSGGAGMSIGQVTVVAPDPIRAHESVLNALAEQAYRQGVVR